MEWLFWNETAPTDPLLATYIFRGDNEWSEYD